MTCRSPDPPSLSPKRGRSSSMSPRERVLAAIRRQPVDRIPTDLWATPEVWTQLRAWAGSDRDVLDALGVDGFATVGAKYVGPSLPSGGEEETVDFWGVRRRKVAFEGGVYEEVVESPLANARSVDDLNRYPWPSPDWFDTSNLRSAAQQAREHRAVMCGYMAPFFVHTLLRGLEQALVDPLENPEFTHVLLGRITDFLWKLHRRMFEASAGVVDVAQVTDDLGAQHGPLMSLEVYRTFYAPHHRRLIQLCREFGLHVFHHNDGSCRMFLPDLVEMGVEVLNPVQWTCPGMDRRELKEAFGQRLCFHGGVENQHILPFGTPDEVRAEVRTCLETLASDGTGYILASCHNLQPNTPLENILALYDEARRSGSHDG